jgi:hypothetical protein
MATAIRAAGTGFFDVYRVEVVVDVVVELIWGEASDPAAGDAELAEDMSIFMPPTGCMSNGGEDDTGEIAAGLAIVCTSKVGDGETGEFTVTVGLAPDIETPGVEITLLPVEASASSIATSCHPTPTSAARIASFATPFAVCFFI